LTYPWLIVAFVAGVVVAWVLLQRGRAALQKEAERLKVDLAQCQISLQAEKEKLAWVEDAKRQLGDTFKALASDELGIKAENLKKTAREELGTLVEPLKEELSKLDMYVRELEGKREGAYSKLGTQLELLQGMQDSLKEQTTVLAQALKWCSFGGS